MATLAVVVPAWELFNHNLFHGWSALPWQLVRMAVPLMLIWSIWIGRSWARYLLAGYCGFILYVNLPLASHFPNMVSKGHTGNVILVLLLFAGYTILTGLTLFSSAISSLMNYRRDERDLN